MFNVTVLNIKDIIKYFIIIILSLIVISVLINFTKKINNDPTNNILDNLNNIDYTNEESISEKNKENEEENKMDSNDNNNESDINSTSNDKNGGFFNIDLLACIDTVSPLVSSVNKEETKELKKYNGNLFEDILKSQIGSIEDYSEQINNDNINTSNDTKEENTNNNSQENIDKADTSNIELAKDGLQTQIITQNPLKLNFNTEYGKVKIKNDTSYNLTEDILNPNIKIDNKNILLFHTHTCESYTSSEKFSYNPTGNFRTTDLNFTVARVGDELENYLKQYNKKVIHDKTYHDYPSYNGSYANSLKTVESILKENPTDIIFDIHRDAIGSRSDYAPVVKIGDNDIAAQIMFVVGTNEGGLWHPNWNQNLKFAIKVQQKAEEMYPGLFKPILLTKYRYNQHVGKYASIIEVGATGNTLEQCNTSMKYFAKVLDEVLK